VTSQGMGSSAFGLVAFSTRMGWVAAVCSMNGLTGLSLPEPSLDEAVADSLRKAGQSLSEGERRLLDAILRRGIFVPMEDEVAAKRVENWLAQLEAQLTQFYAGENVLFGIPLDWSLLTRWQRRVLEEVRKIPWGETRSYGCLAARLGKPGGARAVGQALARNPFTPISPCHRVISANGSLGGFGGGSALKQALLKQEGSFAAFRPELSSDA